MQDDIYIKDTIFALSTPPGRSGVAVIRISGSGAYLALERMARKIPAPRLASLVELYDQDGHAVIDRALILYFPAPNSFTGEDVVEFHTHGGRAVVHAVLAALARLPDFRPAQAGEFTRRAFDNNKLDLTEIEGLADLIDADTEAQRRQALRQMSGALGDLYRNWRERLIYNLAHLEAYLDFPDEEIPPGIFAELQQNILQVKQEMKDHLADNGRGERLREGMTVAILGPPNAGKSSLLNMLARREVAIVSQTAGTTRDTIEVHLDIRGYPVTLVDTAGIRETSNDIEQEGIRRSLMAADRSDFKMILLDADEPLKNNDSKVSDLGAGDNYMVVVNKTDLLRSPFDAEAYRKSYPKALDIIGISIKDGYNLDPISVLLAAQAERYMGLGDAPQITRIRHRQAVEQALEAVTRFVVADTPELQAEDLRTATHSIARITGAVDVEDILDIVFRDFCIGK